MGKRKNCFVVPALQRSVDFLQAAGPKLFRQGFPEAEKCIRGFLVFRCSSCPLSESLPSFKVAGWRQRGLIDRVACFGGKRLPWLTCLPFMAAQLHQ